MAGNVRIVSVNGFRFRDLNRNGTLDPYEDSRLTPDARARDLVSRMTLEEKAGAIMHGTARSVGPMGRVGVGTGYDTAADRELIDGAKVNSMVTRLGGIRRVSPRSTTRYRRSPKERGSVFRSRSAPILAITSST